MLFLAWERFISGWAKRQNCRIWSTQTPHLIIERQRDTPWVQDKRVLSFDLSLCGNYSQVIHSEKSMVSDNCHMMQGLHQDGTRVTLWLHRPSDFRRLLPERGSALSWLRRSSDPVDLCLRRTYRAPATRQFQGIDAVFQSTWQETGHRFDVRRAASFGKWHQDMEASRKFMLLKSLVVFTL
jgi:hypothetical protein